MKISVVIAAYNAERTIAETIESILGQTRQADEIIIADDCSTDGTREVVARYSATTLVTQSVNQGPAAARNAAVRASRGEVIAFVDSDDLWYPDHLERTVGLLDRFPQCGFAFSANDRFGRTQDTQIPDFPADQPVYIHDTLLHGNQIHLLTVALRRAVFDACGGFDDTMRYAEDYDLWLRASLDAPAAYTGKVTASYRMHSGQLNQQLPQIFEGTWRARFKVLDHVRRTTPDRADGLERELGEMWANGLYTAWAVRSRDSLDVMLAMSDHFPNQRGAERRWRWRRRIWPILVQIDRMSRLAPAGIREALRPARMRPTSTKPRI